MKPISDSEFLRFQRFIFDEAGITLSDAKKALVTGRLSKRLAHHQLESFGDYFQLLQSGREPAEVQMAIDLLTTNETYFFREPKHFDFLREQALAAHARGQNFRVWSAASSSGEEAYSIAMVHGHQHTGAEGRRAGALSDGACAPCAGQLSAPVLPEGPWRA